ncbi:malonate transporter subunit MadL [Intestinibacter sp.]
MIVYGVGILSLCFIVGQYIGELLGSALGIGSNVGGVGFAMILLILVTSYMKKKGWFNESSEKGIMFWSSMYIPVVIAMSSIQNVVSALSGGIVAILSGVLSVVVMFALIPLLMKVLGGNNKSVNDKVS